jgi:hypothetical protein
VLFVVHSDLGIDITTLQQKIQKLETMVHESSAPNSQTGKHSSTMVNALNSSLLETTKKFGETLKLRTNVCAVISC